MTSPPLPQQHKVLLAGVSSPVKNESSIAFAMAMLRAQSELLLRRDVVVHVAMATDMNDLLNQFYERRFDTLRTLSVGELLAKAIRFTHADQSVSVLFE